jgi:hypothetical protein
MCYRKSANANVSSFRSALTFANPQVPFVHPPLRWIIIHTHHFIALVFDQLDQVAEFEQRVGDDQLVVVLGANALKAEVDQTVCERFLAPG